MPRLRQEFSIRALRAACGFLTVLRVLPKSSPPDVLPRAAAFFPLVGVLVGAFGAAALLLATQILPPQVAAIFALLATIILTGALHEDGLADTADGLFGGITPERRLEIMRDSRIGTFGAIALWSGLTIRWSAIATLAGHDLTSAALALIFAHGFGRLASIIVAAVLPHPPDSPDHKSGRFIGEFSLFAALPFGIPLVATPFFAFPWQAALAAVLASLAVSVASLPLFKKRLGGVNGDCLGAVNQIAEIAFYLALLASLSAF